MASVSEKRGEPIISEESSTSLHLEPSSPPNKRMKTLTLNLSPISRSKGKEKIEGMKDETVDESIDSDSDSDSDSKFCGICLSEDGKAIRGWIDSCDHYFCFVCIMEWSKVESRCPMCKHRFSSIRRPPKAGVFPFERIVNVPVRDQVYHLLGNVTTGPSDPYAQVQCSECHSITDEFLLLLCDLCDSAAHTYCVGLGATVPEGDWFCHDCTVSKAEHTNDEIGINCDNHLFSRKFDMMPVAEAHVSIFDIVRESDILEADRSPRRTSSHPNQLSSPIVPDREPGARTLHRCRNVQSHIRTLRDNWNALQSGSLGFSSSSLNSFKSSTKHDNKSSSSSLSCQQKIIRDGVSSDTLSNRGSHDIDKAWKMMDIAKSIRRAHQSTSIDHQASNHPSDKGNPPRGATNISSTFLVSKSKPFGHKNRGSVASEMNYNYYSLATAQKNHNSQKSGKQKSIRDPTKEIPKFVEGPQATFPPKYCEFPSTKKIRASVLVDVCHENGGQMSQKEFCRASSNSGGGQVGSACLISLVGSTPRASDPSYAKSELRASSGCEVEPAEGKGVDKNPCEGTSRKDDEAKSEVQALVKLNLKLLSQDKHLDECQLTCRGQLLDLSQLRGIGRFTFQYQQSRE
ncbi:hypothetical protein HHK36_015091 [Tetracentron sinense]|uniref:Uncharacterized protein n=1 Tax=Tetracentron sinense TaxID=13715 RepID=A0A835DDI7_TETSI|nr:hypothetical protein HHK36_015091 [Tetracentron sinense]